MAVAVVAVVVIVAVVEAAEVAEAVVETLAPAQTEAVSDAFGKTLGKSCDICYKVPQTLSLR